MRQQIAKHLANNDFLSPDEATKMVGKGNFLTARPFGKVGCAPLKALYARANSPTHSQSTNRHARPYSHWRTLSNIADR